MALILYPEGERSIDGTPKIFKKGAAILSIHLQVPIVPVAIEGFYEAWPRNQTFQGIRAAEDGHLAIRSSRRRNPRRRKRPTNN